LGDRPTPLPFMRISETKIGPLLHNNRPSVR